MQRLIMTTSGSPLHCQTQVFKQSTFETDSLTHTLELLRGMDGHGFTLITSMCLSKRSRVQDFWIFSAPAPPLPPTTNAGLAAISSLHKAGGSVGGGTMTTTASLEANQPPSPVHSHSMLGLSNTGDSPRTRNAAPRSPAPSSSSGGKPNPAVVANYYDRPPPNPLRRNNESPTTAHSRRTSLPGSSHVLRKTPPVSMSKPGTPTRDYRTPDPTPRPSPRPSPREETGNLQHSSSQPNLPAPTPSHHQYQQYPQLYQQQPGAYAPAPDPNPQRQQQQHLQPPQSHSIIHRPTSDTSSQFLYSVSPPPPGEYQPVYNTVPSGMFILPNIPQSQSQPQATGPPRPSLPGISESPASSIPPPLRDLELEADDATEYDDDGDDEHEGLGISSKLLGSSVFRDTLQTSADYDDDDDDDSPGSGNNHRAYLNSVGVVDYSGVPENDVRRMREATTTIVNEGYAHAGNTPRFVHPDLPEDDPARRASDELLFSFAGSPPAAAPQPFLTSARLPHPQSEDTTLGADRFERYHEAPRQTPAWSGASMDDDSSTMPSPATEEERPTTKAAAAEPISNSGNLAKKQSRSLNPNTGVAKPETSLTVRVVDEQTKNGPWVLVSPPEGAAPNGGAPSSSFPASVVPDAGTSRHRHDVKEQEDGEKNNLGTGVTPPSRPAAVPVPIPTNEERRTATKPRMGTFPWSKSRREQREKEKTQEKEKEKQRKAEEESKRAVPPSSKKPTTAVQKDRDNVESEQRHATITPTPAKPSTEKVEAAATSSSASSSSSSVLQTPSGVAEGHQSPPPINESSFTKDLVGRLRRKPHAITEVGTTEKRLTIE